MQLSKFVLLASFAFIVSASRTTVFIGSGGCDVSDIACSDQGLDLHTIEAYSLDTTGHFSLLNRTNVGGLASWLHSTRHCLFVPLTNSHYLLSYVITDSGKSLKFASNVSITGMNPVFIDDYMEKYLYVAAYHGPDDGTSSTGAGVQTLEIGVNCVLTPSNFIPTSGKSVNPGRQGASHLHSVVVDPVKGFLFACDLGADTIATYEISKLSGKLSSLSVFNATPGSGPRHLVVHPDKRVLYLLHEMGNYVSVMQIGEDGVLKELQSLSTLDRTVFSGYSKAAEIIITSDGSYVFASNRGYGADSGSVAVYHVEQNGYLTLTHHVNAGDKYPRGMELAPDDRSLLVAGQSNSHVTSFDLIRTGDQKYSLELLPNATMKVLPNPTTLAFWG